MRQENELPTRVRLVGALVAGALLAALLPGAAFAGIEQLYDERPPEPAPWLAEWLGEWEEVGAVTVELVTQREELRSQGRIDEALAHAEEIGSGVKRWRPLVELYFRPGDVNWALRIIRCESGGNENAKNRRSSASGLFQHLARYWSRRAPKVGFGDRSVFDPEANVAVAAWLLYKGGGKSHWTCKA